MYQHTLTHSNVYQTNVIDMSTTLPPSQIPILVNKRASLSYNNALQPSTSVNGSTAGPSRSSSPLTLPKVSAGKGEGRRMSLLGVNGRKQSLGEGEGYISGTDDPRESSTILWSVS
jgi:hypothetical protein